MNVLKFLIVFSFTSFLSLFIYLAMSFTGWTANAARSPVVAKINDKKITLKKFQRRYNEIVEEAINPPTKRQFLEDLIRFEVGVQEAQRQKAVHRPEVKLETDKLLYRWLLENKIGTQVQSITVSERDMRAYYRTRPEIKVSHIFLETRRNITTKQKVAYRKRARQIYARVKNSKRPFDQLVRLYTDDISTKNTGGNLGWQASNTMIPNYYNSAVKLRVGQIAPLIETPYGFHIVKLTGKNTYAKANKETLQNAVFEYKKQRLFTTYFAKLKRNYKIRKNPTLMRNLLKSRQSAANKNRSIASVNGQNITFGDFQQRYKQVLSETINPPNQNKFLEDLIQFEMGVQEAEKQRIVMGSQVQRELRKLIYRWLVEKDLGQKVQNIKISENEMRNYYRNNPEMKTSHILIELGPNATQQQKVAARQRAMQIHAEVRKSKRPFAELVKLYTDDTMTRETGGDLGWQTRKTMLPSYYSSVVRLRVGQVARLVETKFGFHIVKLIDRHNYKDASKSSIRLAIFERKRKAIFDVYFDNLKKRYKITRNPAMLK